ncbi:hypothetical protein XENORESO_021091 [Xenotaenia resolanae]|uniref:Uncharacterized protein n=1 Tax=Xenotaenia resolanae TaxID=208358 RepID=A0ABV0WAU1_9TELE
MLAAAQSASPAAHTPMSMTDQWQGGVTPSGTLFFLIITGTVSPVVEADGMLVVSVVVVDGVEHPEERVEPAGHWEMCATTTQRGHSRSHVACKGGRELSEFLSGHWSYLFHHNTAAS